MDVEAGFVGKTAIHPRQVAVIDAAFRVGADELAEAERILASEAAVFQSRGAMCERAPHARWARAGSRCRRTRRAALWNLFHAFVYNVVGVGWAVVAPLPPVFAALAMVASSLVVIAASARLRAVLPEDLAPVRSPTETPARADPPSRAGPPSVTMPVS